MKRSGVTDDQNNALLDWRLVNLAVHACVSDRAASAKNVDRTPPPRSQPAPKRAKMIPFPIGRRRSFVERLAAQIAARPADAGEAHLQQQLKRQGKVLRRKGVSEQSIERELRALTATIRAELWRLLLGTRA